MIKEIYLFLMEVSLNTKIFIIGIHLIILKKQFPSFFKSINFFIAENSGHNAVPTLATPNLLTKLFSIFKERYSSIALLDEEYKIINKPNSIEKEIEKIEDASKLGSKFYPTELAELKGLASREWE